MRYLWIVLLLLVVPASATYVASDLQTICNDYVVGSDNGKTYWDSLLQKSSAELCMGYVAGVMDEMSGEVFRNPADDKLVIGDWDAVYPDQVIRVFLKYVKQNPEFLNKPACVVLRDASEDASLFKYRRYQPERKVTVQ